MHVAPVRTDSQPPPHSASRELMAHTMSLLTRVRVRRVALDKVKIIYGW